MDNLLGYIGLGAVVFMFVLMYIMVYYDLQDYSLWSLQYTSLSPVSLYYYTTHLGICKPPLCDLLETFSCASVCHFGRTSAAALSTFFEVPLFYTENV